MRRRSITIIGMGWLGLAMLLAARPVLASAPTTTDRDQTRADMREILANMQVLLPLSVDDRRFESVEERDRIRSALARLAAGAAGFTSHAAGQGRHVEFLGSSLTREAEEALRRFDDGQYEGAQFFVRRLTDYCVACHGRLPSPSDALVSRDFVDANALAELPLAERATLQMATRRFDDAMQSFEAAFASPEIPAAALFEPLTRYLVVAIRVKGDLERPIPVLRRFAKRPDLGAGMRSDVESWSRALEEFSAQKAITETPTIASARQVLAQARGLIRFPNDRRALVHYLVASSQLHRYLAAHAQETNRDVAEAYYLIGLIESRTNMGYRFFQVEFYLETAIRMAPGDPVAKDAFMLLEEETVLGWVGSAGNSMPVDVQRNLEVLRELVQASPSSSSSAAGGDRDAE